MLELKKTLRVNLIIEQYQQALNAFHNWNFPFSIKANELSNDNPDEDDVNSVVQKSKNALESVLEDIKKEKNNLIPGVHNYIQNFDYNSNFPFFAWSSENYAFEIEQFLNGNKSVIMARSSYTNHDAIKF